MQIPSLSYERRDNDKDIIISIQSDSYPDRDNYPDRDMPDSDPDRDMINAFQPGSTPDSDPDSGSDPDDPDSDIREWDPGGNNKMSIINP